LDPRSQQLPNQSRRLLNSDKQALCSAQSEMQEQHPSTFLPRAKKRGSMI
jgi:hypothetical protein